MKRVIIGVVGLLFLNGCASLVPLSSLLNSPGKTPPVRVHEQTSVDLVEANFELVKTNVVGRSKGFSLLGIITMYPATLNKAMDRLYAQAQMSPGAPQTIAHLVIEQTSTYWILFGIPEVTVRADVVEFKRLSESEHRVRQRTVWEEDD